VLTGFAAPGGRRHRDGGRRRLAADMTDADQHTTAPRASGSPLPTHTITIPPTISMVTLLGPRDEMLRTIERSFPDLDVHVRGNELSLRGNTADVLLVEQLVDQLLLIIDTGQPLNRDSVERSIAMLRNQTLERPADVLTMNIVSNRGRTIRPKTLNQKRYVDAIDEHTVVFGIGPAGTGKTYLAMAKAVAALQAHQVNRIILTRPAVEAGERLGFLPGTLNDKIDPYLRPLYDALHDMIDPESIPRLMAAGTIEVAPLAYMRGRTLNSAFIILDEAQNTSAEQMKMFLTRLGFGSKMVVTGDVTQVDLPGGTTSGLRQVRNILDTVDDIHFALLDSTDVVRHRLVGAIVDAYERSGSRRERKHAGRKRSDRDHPGRDRPDRDHTDVDASDEDGRAERLAT
jgi:phosphate starvation-inducible PhoH-like protein